MLGDAVAVCLLIDLAGADRAAGFVADDEEPAGASFEVMDGNGLGEGEGGRKKQKSGCVEESQIRLPVLLGGWMQD